MQSVQRQFGKLGKRSADETQVSVLLQDFDQADKLLTKIIDASKAWRESWISILTHQHRIVDEYSLLYTPIVGAGDDYHGHAPVETPEHIMRRTARIKQEYEDLKRDLTEDLIQVEERLIKPAQNAKESLQYMRKTIKKREDRKLDFERYQSRLDSHLKKTKHRDDPTLIKSQSELDTAKDLYHAADHNLRGCLPHLLTSVFSLLPHFLGAQVQIQNDLLGHYYTMLVSYCKEEGFPTDQVQMDEVIRLWTDSFRPVQREAESLGILANGKATRASQENGHHGRPPTNGHRRPSASAFSGHRQQSVSPARNLPPSPSQEGKSRISVSPGPSSVLSPVTPSEGIASPSPSLSVYQTPGSFSPAAPNTDYFSRDRQPSATSNLSIASVAQKKRPPPPPPPRQPSQQSIFVTALYDFDGQSTGDLSFREGDRIRVTKRTDSTDDWWQGELRGLQGPFPANYVQ